MKRKDYQRPTAQVVKLQQQCQILAGSGNASRTSYGNATVEDWE